MLKILLIFVYLFNSAYTGCISTNEVYNLACLDSNRILVASLTHCPPSPPPATLCQRRQLDYYRLLLAEACNTKMNCSVSFRYPLDLPDCDPSYVPIDVGTHCYSATQNLNLAWTDQDAEIDGGGNIFVTSKNYPTDWVANDELLAKISFDVPLQSLQIRVMEFAHVDARSYDVTCAFNLTVKFLNAAPGYSVYSICSNSDANSLPGVLATDIELYIQKKSPTSKLRFWFWVEARYGDYISDGATVVSGANTVISLASARTTTITTTISTTTTPSTTTATTFTTTPSTTTTTTSTTSTATTTPNTIATSSATNSPTLSRTLGSNPPPPNTFSTNTKPNKFTPSLPTSPLSTDSSTATTTSTTTTTATTTSATTTTTISATTTIDATFTDDPDDTVNSTEMQAKSSPQNDNVAIAIGATVGGFAFLILTLLIICLICLKRNNSSKETTKIKPIIVPIDDADLEKSSEISEGGNSIFDTNETGNILNPKTKIRVKSTKNKPAVTSSMFDPNYYSVPDNATGDNRNVSNNAYSNGDKAYNNGDNVYDKNKAYDTNNAYVNPFGLESARTGDTGKAYASDTVDAEPPIELQNVEALPLGEDAWLSFKEPPVHYVPSLYGFNNNSDKKEKSTDCDSAWIPLLCVHG